MAPQDDTAERIYTLRDHMADFEVAPQDLAPKHLLGELCAMVNAQNGGRRVAGEITPGTEHAYRAAADEGT